MLYSPTHKSLALVHPMNPPVTVGNVASSKVVSSPEASPAVKAQEDVFVGAKSVKVPKTKSEAIALRDSIVALCKSNTTDLASIGQLRAQLNPMLDAIETYFAANRPENETELTKGVWKNLWYDDPDIKDRGLLRLNRDKIWQVVRDGYYYNVSDSKLATCGLSLGSLSNYLKGAYTIKNKPTAANKGAKRLNVIDLEFVYNGLRFGKLPKGAKVDALVDKVENSTFGSLKIPGPYGVQGELWNLYIDDEVRISAGFDKSNPDVLDVYILERGESV